MGTRMGEACRLGVDVQTKTQFQFIYHCIHYLINLFIHFFYFCKTGNAIFWNFPTKNVKETRAINKFQLRMKRYKKFELILLLLTNN